MEKQINPDRLCMGCMEEKTGPGPCPRCGFDEEALPRDSYALPCRTILAGRYLVGRVMREEQFGITYLAMDLEQNRKVAIQEYFPFGVAARGGGEAETPNQEYESYYAEGREQYSQQAQEMAQLESLPGIAAVENVFSENNTVYTVMEYLEGDTLEAYLQRQGGTLLPDQALAWVRPMVRGLVQIHKAGRSHGEISTESMVVTPEGQLKLMTLGAARHVASQNEQGQEADVNAVCAALYRCLTGVFPQVPWQPVAAFGVPITQRQEEALQQGLMVEPGRPRLTMEELERALYPPEPRTAPVPPADAGPRTEPVQKPAETPPGEPEKPKSRKLPLLLILAVVVIAAAVGLWWFLSGSSSGEPEESEAETEEATEAPSEEESSASMFGEPTTQASTEAPTEPSTEASTEAPTEEPTEPETVYDGSYDPAQWVYGYNGEEDSFHPLDSILNRILNDDYTIAGMEEDITAENGVQYQVQQVQTQPECPHGAEEACMLVQITAGRTADCSFSSLYHSCFSMLVSSEDTGRVLLCPWDRLYPGPLEEAAAASDGWSDSWVLEGQTVTLHIPIPAGYESWMLVFANHSHGEAVGPVYLTLE